MDNASHGASSWPRGTIAGTWHLLDETTDEGRIPAAHRVDFRFNEEPAGVRAAVISRRDAGEIAAIHTASFNGEVLRLQMAAPADKPQAEMPLLVMRVTGDKLVGHWELQGAVIGPGLKLVRAHGESTAPAQPAHRV